MPRSYLFVMWPGGGNVNPFLGLAEVLRPERHHVAAVAPAMLHDRLEGAGIGVVATVDGWLAEAADVVDAVDRSRPDVLVVDYMLTAALCGAERTGVPTVALVHTLYRALLLDGAPEPIAMGGGVEMLNEVRSGLGLDPIGRHADLLDVCERVLVTAPPELDEAGDVPANVAYAGALFEGPGADAGWRPPAGEGPLVVVSVGTAGNPEVETDLLGRVVRALDDLPVRGLVTVPDHVDRSRLPSAPDVTLSGYVRHSAVLPHAHLLVTHAGLGSVVAALAHGVPMVCLPLDREQPANAAAVDRIGAGTALDPDAGEAEIRAGVERELARHDPVVLPADPTISLELLSSVGP